MSGANGTNGSVRPHLSRFGSRGRGHSQMFSSGSLQAGMHAARERFRELNLAGYRSARPSIYRKTAPALGGTADAHYSRGLELFRIRELAREFDRDDPNIDSLLERALDNVLGSGLVVDPQTADPRLNETLRLWWREVTRADAIDWYGESDLDELERLALRHCWVDGDAFMIFDDRRKLVRFEEADRCDSLQDLSSNTIHGVARDEAGRLRGFTFALEWKRGERQRLQGSQQSRRDFVEVPARDVIHVHLMRRRKTQSRGISAFSPVFDAIAIVGNAEFAQLVKLQVSSCIAMFLELNFPESFLLGGSKEEKSALDRTTDLEFDELSPGMIARLGLGEKANGFSPSVRTEDDAKFIEGRLRQISNRIGLPLELGMLTSSNQSFSALRGVLEAAKIGWRRTQRYMRAIRSRIYEWRVRLAVEDGDLPPRDDIAAHEILTPSWPYLDPLTDAQADALRIDKHLSSPRQVWADRGRDYETGVREIVEDRASLVEAAVAKTKDLAALGIKIDWRELLGMPAPTAQPVADDAPGGEPPAEAA